jgi:elongation factor P
MGMINVQDIRKGSVFKFEGAIWTVMFMQHVSPGKGSAFVKVKARNQATGNQKEVNFRSGEKIETIDVFEKDVTYSYRDGDEFVFMDNENFEQYHVDINICEDLEKYIVLNGQLTANLVDEKVMSINLPNFVVLEVTRSDPGVKGDTATKTTKPAECETGLTLQVPLFIKEGDKLKIDTRTGEYIERVNK